MRDRGRADPRATPGGLTVAGTGLWDQAWASPRSPAVRLGAACAVVLALAAAVWAVARRRGRRKGAPPATSSDSSKNGGDPLAPPERSIAMYRPPFTRGDAALALPFMVEHPFVTLSYPGPGGVPGAVHVPVVTESFAGAAGGAVEGVRLRGHVARANRCWDSWGGAADPPVLAVFHGPHAYVSPVWYADGLDRAVPTWNFAAVHARGKLRVLGDHETDAQRDILEALVGHSEAARVRAEQKAMKQLGLTNARAPPPWSAARMDREVFEQARRRLVFFEVTVTSVEFKDKMSQNRSERDRRSVSQHLAMLGELDAAARVMASLGDPAGDKGGGGGDGGGEGEGAAALAAAKLRHRMSTRERTGSGGGSGGAGRRRKSRPRE